MVGTIYLRQKSIQQRYPGQLEISSPGLAPYWRFLQRTKTKGNFMNEGILKSDSGKKGVVEYFGEQSEFWSRLYDENDVYAVIHQQRLEIALQFFDEIGLSKNAKILEIGCGAGFMTVNMAKRGFTVESIDTSEEMVRLTASNTKENGVNASVNVSQGDIYNLAHADESIDFIVMLGVIPWLPDVDKALAEVQRVLKKGGHIILNSDNRYRLPYLINPYKMPALESLKLNMLGFLESQGLRKPLNAPRAKNYPVKNFLQRLSGVGLQILNQKMFGFGPFQFMGFPMVSKRFGISLNHKLQRLADRNVPLFRTTGAQHIFLARKQ